MKEYLMKIGIMDKQINQKLYELYEIKNALYGTGMSNDNERVQTSGDKDRIGNMVSKIVDLEKEVDALIDEFVDFKKDVLEIISSLANETQKQVLFKKYFEYKSIYIIAVELGMSERGCKKSHKRALEEFEKIKKHNI